MKVAIAGVSGFIGRNLRCIFSANDKYVVSLPREITANDLIGVDVVINLVGRAHQSKDNSHDSISEYRKVNCDYATDLYKLCGNLGIKQFVQISSIGVLGNSTGKSPFMADSSIMPVEEYAKSKALAESMLMELARDSITNLCIIRPPLVYGPKAPGNIKRLLKLSLMPLPMPFGMVRNRRDFVSIYNLVDLIMTCLVNPKARNGIFLVSDNEPISTPQLMKHLANSKDKRVIQLPLPVFILKILAKIVRKEAIINRLTGNLEVDISQTRHILNWSPPYTVNESFARIKEELK